MKILKTNILFQHTVKINPLRKSWQIPLNNFSSLTSVYVLGKNKKHIPN